MMHTEMDWAKLLSSKRRKELHGSTESIGTGIGREEIERDYDRVLFAAPTRRLADKTQVFPMETNDSVRTRLTHSHEVSNLARSIGVRLVYNHGYREKVFGQDADTLKVERKVPALLAAVGLAHDLGNPPFGHQGEQTIKRWCQGKENSDKDFKDCPDFTDFSEFDGNCQTFRLLTKLQILNDQFGLNLTCATLAALMKYPVFSKDKKGFKKFGLFHSEQCIAREVWDQTGLAEGVRHPLVYVMEACDDIAYSVIDAEDTVKKGYASFVDLIDFLRSEGNCQDEKIKEVIEASLKKNEEFKQKQLRLSPSELNDLSMQMFRVKAIAVMVESATATFVQNVGCILSGRIKPEFEIIENSETANLCSCLKNFDKRYGFHHPDVLRLELKGNNYIRFVMDALWRGIDSSNSDPFASYAYRKISENYRRIYESSDKEVSDKLHLLCDQISGMTESYLGAVRDDLLNLTPSRIPN